MASKYTHLCLFKKDDLIQLLREGGLIAYCPSVVVDISSDIKCHAAAEKLFASSNPIDYSINYFILLFESDKKSIAGKCLEIRDLQAIYPLDEESARFGIILEPSVALQPPIFGKEYREFKKRQLLAESEKGVDNIRQMFGYDKLKAPSKFSIEDKNALIESVMDDEGLTGAHSIWSYLLAYTRTQNYPKDGRGCFYDAFHVFANYERKGAFEGSVAVSKAAGAIGKMENARYYEILEALKVQTTFIKASDKAFKGFWRIAPLFFNLKSWFEKNSGSIIAEKIQAIKENYDEPDLKLALYLLGFCLGQQNTYKDLYAMMDYPFLK